MYFFAKIEAKKKRPNLLTFHSNGKKWSWNYLGWFFYYLKNIDLETILKSFINDFQTLIYFRRAGSDYHIESAKFQKNYRVSFFLLCCYVMEGIPNNNDQLGKGIRKIYS